MSDIHIYSGTKMLMRIKNRDLKIDDAATSATRSFRLIYMN